MTDLANSPDPALDRFLAAHSLISPGEQAHWQPLTGGVSSDIWRVDINGRSLCVKRALSQLKVAADWKAPVSRNAFEWAWMRFAARHCPENVPQPVAHEVNGSLRGLRRLAFEVGGDGVVVGIAAGANLLVYPEDSLQMPQVLTVAW